MKWGKRKKVEEEAGGGGGETGEGGRGRGAELLGSREVRSCRFKFQGWTTYSVEKLNTHRGAGLAALQA